MIVIIQRVLRGSVKIEGKEHSEIGKGCVILVGFCKEDKEEYVDKMANKIKNLRIFEDEEGKMNKSINEINGEILLVPNFTLCASIRKGRRPSFDNAMEPESAKKLFNIFESKLRNFGINVKTGIFGAKMEVEIINDGPVTFIITNEDLGL
ncbi:MAG: D-aminoacyl-tRNA deacylase [candidate division WOR-3 bacterium]